MSVRKTDTWFNPQNLRKSAYQSLELKNPVCIEGQDIVYSFDYILRHINTYKRKVQTINIPDPSDDRKRFNINSVVAVEAPGRPPGEYEETWKLLKDNVWTKAPSNSFDKIVKEKLNPNLWKGKEFAGKSPLQILVNNGKRIVAYHHDGVNGHIFIPYTGKDKRFDLPYRWTDDMTKEMRQYHSEPYSVSSDGLLVKFRDRLPHQFMEILASVLKTDLTIIESDNTRSRDYFPVDISRSESMRIGNGGTHSVSPFHRFSW